MFKKQNQTLGINQDAISSIGSLFQGILKGSSRHSVCCDLVLSLTAVSILERKGEI